MIGNKESKFVIFKNLTSNLKYTIIIISLKCIHLIKQN